MYRRQLLSGICAGASVLAGCLSSDSQSIEYEQCDMPYLRPNWLPEPARQEVETAIDQGMYETSDALILPEVMDIDDAYLYTYESSTSSTYYYTVEIEENGDTNQIRVAENYPKTGAPTVSNQREETVTCEIRVFYATPIMLESPEEVSSDATELLERIVEIESGGSIELNGDIDYRYGTYWTEVIIDGSNKTETIEWKMDEAFSKQPLIMLDSDGSVSSRFGSESEYGMSHCQWSENGNVSFTR